MGKKILVTDDDAMNLRMAEMFLTKGGYEVVKASGGKECLDYLNTDTPDLILLDVEMPGIDGYETLAAIRKNPEHAKIPGLFLSASEDVAERAAELGLAAAGVVSKPFLPPVLLAQVAEVFGE